MIINDNATIQGTLNATALQKGGVPVIVSSILNDVVTISQVAYNALGPGRPAGRFYLITS